MPHDNIRQNEQTGGDTHRASEMSDPIDDLCERLCALHIIDEVGSNNPLGREAAAILERLRAERDCLKHELAEVRSVLQVTIAARNTYMAERDTLAAIDAGRKP